MSQFSTIKGFNKVAAAALAASSLSLGLGACITQAAEGQSDPVNENSAIETGSTLYVIRSDASGKVLDVAGLSRDNGAPVQQYSGWGGDNQKWRLERSGGFFQIVSALSGKCLDVSALSRDDGAKLQQWDCSGAGNQQWDLRATGDGSFTVVNVNSGKCLDLPASLPDDSLVLQQWGCWATKGQHWRFEPASGGGPNPPGAIDSLKAAAESRGLLAGVALSTQHFDDQAYLDLIAREFDYVTPENEMKWDATEPSPGNFSFGGADAIVDFAQKHGMKVKGHTLVWHSQLPDWVKGIGDPNQIRATMYDHIRALVGRYRGRVIAWDVVNEVIDDGNGNALRDDVFHRLGDTYIDEAFRIAHDADPDALLFYNDYGIEGLDGKANAAYALVKRLVESGVPISGVGLQTHIGMAWPSANDIAANVQRLTDLGLRVNISELDVSVCDAGGDRNAKLAQQQQRYHDVVAACAQNAKCHAVTVWGPVDKYSWLNGFAPCSGGQTGSPWGLPFDDNYNRKPAWQGMADALAGR